MRVGRYGPYFEKQENGNNLTASIPEDMAPAELSNEIAEKLLAEKQKGPKSLGMHPQEGLPIYLLNGPFGAYLQLGEVIEDAPKPKRASLLKIHDPETLTLENGGRTTESPQKIWDIIRRPGKW